MTTIESSLMVTEVEIRSYKLAAASTCNTSRPNWVWIADSSLHHTVFVSGAAAGLELASKLGDSLSRREKVPIALVEHVRTLIYKPHLHEVAAGTMHVGRGAIDNLAQASDHHFRYRIGEMIGLERVGRKVYPAAGYDAEGQDITLPGTITYETLVIAFGSTSNDSGTKDFAISLNIADQVVRFHQRLVNRFVWAHSQPSPVRARRTKPRVKLH
jgi:NADH dehydrogenase